jgi:uncharacterized protein YbaP (TraB family)
MCASVSLIPSGASVAQRDHCVYSTDVGEGKKYLGKRFTLRKEAEDHPEKISALVFQTIHMFQQSLHRGFLWSAKCLSTGHRVSLFGTIHDSIVCLNGWRFCAVYHPIVREKLDQCQSLYVEYDLSTLSLNQRRAIQNVLKKSLESDENEKFLSIWNQKLLKFSSPHLPLDIGLLVRAHEIGKRVISLETLDMQFANFFQNLREASSEPFLGEKKLDILDSAQSGNFEQLSVLCENSIKEMALLKERNAAFALQIEKALKSGERGMFAFGVAHFIGETGVLKLLSSKPDIEISRIDLP